MSQPSFPAIDPEMTFEHALNMILTSIAMEELALSHILNAEGEKLQYVLGTLGTENHPPPCIEELLEINRSVCRLLEGVWKNQDTLKSKMERVLEVMPPRCVKPPKPPCKCNAVFKGLHDGEVWRADGGMAWKCENVCGMCVYSCKDNTRIPLYPGKSYTVSFAANIKSAHCFSGGEVIIRLQKVSGGHCSDIFTFHHPELSADSPVTASSGGIIVKIPADGELHSLMLRLISPDSLIVDDSMLSIAEI